MSHGSERLGDYLVSKGVFNQTAVDAALADMKQLAIMSAELPMLWASVAGSFGVKRQGFFLTMNSSKATEEEAAGCASCTLCNEIAAALAQQAQVKQEGSYGIAPAFAPDAVRTMLYPGDLDTLTHCHRAESVRVSQFVGSIYDSGCTSAARPVDETDCTLAVHGTTKESGDGSPMHVPQRALITAIGCTYSTLELAAFYYERIWSEWRGLHTSLSKAPGASRNALAQLRADREAAEKIALKHLRGSLMDDAMSGSRQAWHRILERCEFLFDQDNTADAEYFWSGLCQLLLEMFPQYPPFVRMITSAANEAAQLSTSPELIAVHRQAQELASIGDGVHVAKLASRARKSSDKYEQLSWERLIGSMPRRGIIRFYGNSPAAIEHLLSAEANKDLDVAVVAAPFARPPQLASKEQIDVSQEIKAQDALGARGKTVNIVLGTFAQYEDGIFTHPGALEFLTGLHQEDLRRVCTVAVSAPDKLMAMPAGPRLETLTAADRARIQLSFIPFSKGLLDQLILVME